MKARGDYHVSYEPELKLERKKMTDDVQIFRLCPIELTEDVVNICQWY